jgi:hypothetical protein
VSEEGSLNVICNNRTNGIIHLGHTTGTVTLWSPNSDKFVAKMLCHRVSPQTGLGNLSLENRLLDRLNIQKFYIWDENSAKILLVSLDRLFQGKISDRGQNKVKRKGTESLSGFKTGQGKPCSAAKSASGLVFLTLFCLLFEI